jgi:predicted TIM-barrel fold metal-dependent hydrolase
MTIYDIHSHWGTERFYPLRGAAQQARQIDIWKTECRFVDEGEMAGYIRSSGVKTMLDIGFTRGLPLDQVRSMHDQMIAFQRANADVVLGNWLQLSPDTGTDGIDEIERCRASRAGLFGLAVSAIGNRRPITDESFRPFYEHCQRVRMPVMFFVGYTGVGAGMPGGDGIRLELGHPRDVDDIAASYPGLQIVVGRNPWPWTAEMIAVMLHKPNVWIEFHGMSPRRLPDELKQEIRGRLKSRVMFGCDYPLLRFEKIIGDWRSDGYPDDVLERVFSRNAERFLETIGRD